MTQYLTEKGVRETFDFLARVGSGSKIVFTYVRKDFIDGKDIYDSEIFYKKYVKNNIWLFGMDPKTLLKFLDEYGWKVIERCRVR